MKIDNGELLSLLFKKNQEVAGIIKMTTAYILTESTATLIFIVDSAQAKKIISHAAIICSTLNQVLGYKICLQYERTIEEVSMIATEINILKESTTSFVNLQSLARATNKSIPEVKILLAEMDAAIYPQRDGSEAIREETFDHIILDWAKSFKTADIGMVETSNKKARKPTPKVLISELTESDIARVKSGNRAGSPNLQPKGIQETLLNLFSKVRLEDTTTEDAVAAFIEGSSELGLALRKKIITAYKKFTKANVQEVEDKLVEGAKDYLKTLTSAVES